MRRLTVLLAVVALFGTSGCGLLSALGPAYQKDDIDRFHANAMEIKGSIKTAREQIAALQQEAQSDPGAFMANGAQRLATIGNSLGSLPDKALGMVSSGQSMLTSAPSQYAGPQILHLPRKLQLLKEAVGALSDAPGEIVALVECVGALTSGGSCDASALEAPAIAEVPTTETQCDDGGDNDGDQLVDCADKDCAAAPGCQADGDPENTDARCSDWVDNDENGHMDCDDTACSGAGITVCLGSWDMGQGAVTPAPAAAGPTAPAGDWKIGALGGQGGDIVGERSDLECSDGIDNDGDGKVDCEDVGCRFGPDVLICRGTPKMRFSIVSRIDHAYDLEAEQHDTLFSKLQLRSFGPIPNIANSFYLVSMRAEKTPRLTWAMFQLPIGNGHYFQLNSGGGGLTDTNVISSGKQLLLDPAYYMLNAFQQGNGAAVEIGGPIGWLNDAMSRPAMWSYRAFYGGGSGRWAGNIGGRYFTYDNHRYTWSAGGVVSVNLVGYLGRWDSMFLYTPAPLAVNLRLGGKFDQRAQERFPAANGRLAIRAGRILIFAESYMKWEQEFVSYQQAYNITFGLLAIPRWLMVAFDYGQFKAEPYENLPATIETDIKKIRDTERFRFAAHLYAYRNIGLVSLLYDNERIEGTDWAEESVKHTVRLAAQYRF
jgi:hypothetical protein